jgi:uncharacterized coiled-coil protein SlyX
MMQTRDYNLLCFGLVPILLLKAAQMERDRRIEALEAAIQASQTSFLELLMKSVHAQRLVAQRKKENGATAVLLLLECLLAMWSDG